MVRHDSVADSYCDVYEYRIGACVTSCNHWPQFYVCNACGLQSTATGITGGSLQYDHGSRRMTSLAMNIDEIMAHHPATNDSYVSIAGCLYVIRRSRPALAICIIRVCRQTSILGSHWAPFYISLSLYLYEYVISPQYTELMSACQRQLRSVSSCPW